MILAILMLTSVDGPPQSHQTLGVQRDQRRATADSDDYVKISEPIYDYPPKAAEPRRISPTEAAQLQELCQEYDFGLDIPGVASIPPTQVAQSPMGVLNVPINKVLNVPIQQASQESRQQQQQQQGDGFIPEPYNVVIEEDMLNSEHGGPSAHRKSKPAHSMGAEATSRQVKTNDVFDRMETEEHDDMTYAPEIQSVEIPPDQMSETSENIIDYFDRVAADSDAQLAELQREATLKRQSNQIEQSNDSLLKPIGRAPQILPAFGNRAHSNSSIGSTGRSGSAVSSDGYPYRHLRKQSSLLSVLGVTSMQEILLTITSLDSLSEAMKRAGLETTNLIFGIDYTASNKYQGEESFGGRSLHTIHPNVKNPYQQVISILGRTLAPFAGTGHIGVYGFGDATTGDWSVFNLSAHGDCRDLDEVLSVYNNVTPKVALSGPTNFAPLIYQAMEICQKSRDYHILVIIADGQVTNERATRRAIVQACQHPLSIIVVGVGDGPWDMMRVFDESLPKRPWDNFHFVEFHEIVKKSTSVEEGDVKLAVQSLLEIPDQYRCICELGLLDRSIPPRGSEIRRELMHNPL
ncbi:unnamed protein product [Caenorhabditis bovis]|uniref:VWFA domain-containing protein n=1 Tax=Caenorhabditis bovis TaxID=2654633 RepID=A0A8S1FFQ0_9PELO|nr:unnamed protein product [Caenorhabditis bovis]